jgi:hypothetical protein
MLTIYTAKSIFIYNDENAKRVYEAINNAGARGSGWTTPTKLIDGTEVVFVISNIIAFEYR